MINTILITGGTSGIGFSLAEAYLKLGHRVIITGRSEEKLYQAATKLGEYKTFLITENVDVINSKLMSDILLKYDDKYKIDIIIANAGVSAGVLENSDIQRIAENIFNINVFGVFNTIHPLLERMKKRRAGKIVIISSMSAFFGMKSAIFYASSKAAIKSYGEGLRILLKEHNINVTTVFPGFVDSNITKVNKFKMPFFMDSKKAANIIITGIKKNKGYIMFPLRMYLMVYFISILPFSLREKILEKLPNKE